MENIDKRNPNNWTNEERDRVVGAFNLLIEMDKKQNPHLYKKTPTHEKGQNVILKKY